MMTTKFILFSDCHRGDNSFADDFANNRNIYFHALKHYYKEGFSYCELGDGDELWENLSFQSIFYAHKNVYMLMKQFHDEERLHMIWGNHDMVYRHKNYVSKTLNTYFDPKTGKDEDLFCDICYHEGLVLKHSDNQVKNYSYAMVIRPIGGIISFGNGVDLWYGYFGSLLNVMGIADPTSPAKNYKELIKIERRTKKWIIANNNLITIAGHTHRPRFPDPGDIAFFNDGSCVHPRSITGIEIENGAISLIKWQIVTTDDGTLKIDRFLLEGPTALISL